MAAAGTSADGTGDEGKRKKVNDATRPPPPSPPSTSGAPRSPARSRPRCRSRRASASQLDLAANNFSSAVPVAFLASTTLRSLDLGFNRLSGPLEIPPRPLAQNFSSPLPCGALTRLRLAGYLLVGGIPSGVAQCRALRVLDLSRNVLEGAVPRALGRLAALWILDVLRNSLTDRVPAELADCRDLAVLVLTNLTASPTELPRKAKSRPQVEQR